MNFARTFFATILTSAVLLVAAPLAAQDVVTVGTVTASGTNVTVPIYVRDVTGTPLGVDRPAGSRIQSLSIKVVYSPTASISSISIARAGVTASLNPTSEFKPVTSNSVSLLTTFSESTSPIPFRSNPSAPGDLVAQLTIALSSAAEPGTSIALTLDTSLTQLTDAGGTAATKETVANGELKVVNGAVQVPALALTLASSNPRVAVGSSTSVTASLNFVTSSSTLVTITSSNPSIATMPASVTIPAGSRTASFTINGVATGTSTITASLPSSVGGGTATASLTVIPRPTTCNPPSAPAQLTVPPAATAGQPYSISWSAVAEATDYQVEESIDPTFTGATQVTATSASATFTHADPATFFYRVRAHSKTTDCDTYSLWTTTSSVTITTAPLPVTRVLAVVGSTPGAFGSYFRTSVQLYNATSLPIAGKVVFHTAGASGSPSDPSMTYSLQPGKAVAWSDLLPAIGVATGLGTADVIADAGSAFPVAAVRVFNDAGAAGTTGSSQELLRLEDALAAGQTGVIIAPADASKFRLNVGVRTLTQGVSMNVILRDAEGAVVKTVGRTYPATFFTQVTAAALLDGYTFTGGETLSFQVTEGSAFVYGSTTDNVTNDPSQQFARRND